jgi:hypothetical protein
MSGLQDVLDAMESWMAESEAYILPSCEALASLCLTTQQQVLQPHPPACWPGCAAASVQ